MLYMDGWIGRYYSVMGGHSFHRDAGRALHFPVGRGGNWVIWLIGSI